MGTDENLGLVLLDEFCAFRAFAERPRIVLLRDAVDAVSALLPDGREEVLRELRAQARIAEAELAVVDAALCRLRVGEPLRVLPEIVALVVRRHKRLKRMHEPRRRAELRGEARHALREIQVGEQPLAVRVEAVPDQEEVAVAQPVCHVLQRDQPAAFERRVDQRLERGERQRRRGRQLLVHRRPPTAADLLLQKVVDRADRPERVSAHQRDVGAHGHRKRTVVPQRRAPLFADELAPACRADLDSPAACEGWIALRDERKRRAGDSLQNPRKVTRDELHLVRRRAVNDNRVVSPGLLRQPYRLFTSGRRAEANT